MKFIILILSFTLLFSCKKDEENKHFHKPSIIIGEVNWFPATRLGRGPARNLSHKVGVLNAGGLRCTGWIYNQIAYTAKHCLTRTNVTTLNLWGNNIPVVFDRCDYRSDICTGYVNYGDIIYRNPVPYHGEKRSAYLLHQQNGTIMVSVSCLWWKKTEYRIYHTCDSNYGSSGGMLVDASTHIPIAVHTGGIPSLNVNTGVNVGIVD